MASAKQIQFVKSLLSSLHGRLEAADNVPDEVDAAILALLSPIQGTIVTVQGPDAEDLSSSAVSAAITALKAAVDLVPSNEIRWVKEGAEFLLKGSTSVLVTGTEVVVHSRKGEKKVWVGDVVRTEGTVAFARPGENPNQALAAEGLDLNVLFDGLVTQSGDARTDIWVADPTDTEGRLKLHIQRPRHGRWAGWIFVKDGATHGYGNRYGKQAPGKAYEGEAQDALANIAADRVGAFQRYGQLTETCGVCGKPLEEELSVASGIGPWCAAKLEIDREALVSAST